DANELGQFTDWLKRPEPTDTSAEATVRRQFRGWVENRLKEGPLLFLGCFTEQGNLLSQWRGYCRTGNGVSLGFDAGALVATLTKNKYRIGKVIYAKDKKEEIVHRTVDKIVATATRQGEDSSRPTAQSYYRTFAAMEEEILAIAALMKAYS